MLRCSRLRSPRRTNADKYARPTDLKQTEDALRESEARYREIFDDAPGALWVDDWSLVKQMIDRLSAEGVGDWRAYFAGCGTSIQRARDEKENAHC